MIKTTTHTLTIRSLLSGKLHDYFQLIKFRLTLLVVFSAAIGYLFAPSVAGNIHWQYFSLLLLSGFLITGSANGINQIIERDLDKLMLRTANRPLAEERISVAEAGVLTSVLGIAGVIILGVYMNALSAILGLSALLSYAFIYTPLKRVSPVAVFAGAFPGAIPTMIGYTAAAGKIDLACLLLFAIQFIWQFPHFWSLAWMLDNDYRRAGFHLLPSKEGRNKKSAFIISVSTALLLPLTVFSISAGVTGVLAGSIVLVCSSVLFYLSFLLYKKGELADAKKLMFASFIYLPVVQIILLLDKLI